jgi:hypothetical protein
MTHVRPLDCAGELQCKFSESIFSHSVFSS